MISSSDVPDSTVACLLTFRLWAISVVFGRLSFVMFLDNASLFSRVLLRLDQSLSDCRFIPGQLPAVRSLSTYLKGIEADRLMYKSQ
jgi:hypothetical protein